MTEVQNLLYMNTILTPIKQECYSRFQKLIMRFSFSINFHTGGFLLIRQSQKRANHLHLAQGYSYPYCTPQHIRA